MKALWLATIFLFTLAVLLLVNQFFFCPRFVFHDPVPFAGKTIYNPYATLKPNQWVKCNFHAHIKTWSGITNGHGNAGNVHNAYKSLKYGIHCISNYQEIDTSGSCNKSYIPAYEHGYNINKTHQLILGSNKVQWLDYLLPQSIDNKQDVLNHLKGGNSLIILDHPEMRNGYAKSDLAWLSGYDCMEVLNPSVISTSQWDAALSAGKKVFIVGDDDLHNVLTKERLGKMCTYVNVRKNRKELVLNALKTGNSYGAVLGDEQNIDSVPKLENFLLNQDTISIQVDQPAKEIVLTGQNGRILGKRFNSDHIRYTLKEKDHYARATFIYKNGTSLYLNPVFYLPESGYVNQKPFENLKATIFYRCLGITILLFWCILIGLLFKKRRDEYSVTRAG
jgi:hypothetical protein